VVAEAVEEVVPITLKEVEVMVESKFLKEI
jgi:hypothetical protein